MSSPVAINDASRVAVGEIRLRSAPNASSRAVSTWSAWITVFAAAAASDAARSSPMKSRFDRSSEAIRPALISTSVLRPLMVFTAVEQAQQPVQAACASHPQLRDHEPRIRLDVGPAQFHVGTRSPLGALSCGDAVEREPVSDVDVKGFTEADRQIDVRRFDPLATADDPFKGRRPPPRGQWSAARTCRGPGTTPHPRGPTRRGATRNAWLPRGSGGRRPTAKLE